MNGLNKNNLIDARIAIKDIEDAMEFKRVLEAEDAEIQITVKSYRAAPFLSGDITASLPLELPFTKNELLSAVDKVIERRQQKLKNIVFVEDPYFKAENK